MSNSAFAVGAVLLIIGLIQSFGKGDSGLVIAGSIILAGGWIGDAIRQSAARSQSRNETGPDR